MKLIGMILIFGYFVFLFSGIFLFQNFIIGAFLSILWFFGVLSIITNTDKRGVK